ncbi:MAG TPA: hypothetical protein VM681_09145 [Candidatus Thermoplasmatota archaeon]|nr:hypothetical protein [Candidatus Thermoplasmatota archaeon]
MREFLVAFSRARSAPDVPLDDLPSSGGRFDLVCRVVAAAFLVSNGIRRDVRLTLVLEGPPKPPLAVRLRGDALRNLHPDERSIAAWLLRAMAKPSVPGAWLSAGDGIELSRALPSDVLAERPDAPLVVLAEDGVPLEKAELPAGAWFVLGDDRGVPPSLASALSTRRALRLSVGPVSLHTDQCVAILHNALDRAGATR